MTTNIPALRKMPRYVTTALCLENKCPYLHSSVLSYPHENSGLVCCSVSIFAGKERNWNKTKQNKTAITATTTTTTKWFNFNTALCYCTELTSCYTMHAWFLIVNCQHLMAFVTKIRVSFRVMRGNRNLCPLDADLHGAMFASNVACHKMRTAESFCVGRTYLELACDCHVHSRAGEN